jgi:hypothetical protein
VAAIGPAGLQLAITARPAGRSARASSAAAGSAGANITPNTEMTRSNDPSSNGSEVASAVTHSTSTPAARARAAPAVSIEGSASVAITRAPRSAASRAEFPVPQATSRRSAPAAGFATSITWAEAGSSERASGV